MIDLTLLFFILSFAFGVWDAVFFLYIYKIEKSFEEDNHELLIQIRDILDDIHEHIHEKKIK